MELPETPLEIVCDGDRIQQVLTNLLSNAAKFSSRDGQVAVAAWAEGANAIVTVQDEGIGIPAAALSSLFDRYRQAHRGKGGTGLGLAIVKEFVQAHGGGVAVESKEGEGSRFTISLPRRGPST